MTDEIAKPEVERGVVAGGDEVGEPVGEADEGGLVGGAEEVERGAVIIAGTIKKAEDFDGFEIEEGIGEDLG